jgi:hypothetical protein
VSVIRDGAEPVRSMVRVNRGYVSKVLRLYLLTDLTLQIQVRREQECVGDVVSPWRGGVGEKLRAELRRW